MDLTDVSDANHQFCRDGTSHLSLITGSTWRFLGHLRAASDRGYLSSISTICASLVPMISVACSTGSKKNVCPGFNSISTLLPSGELNLYLPSLMATAT